MTAQETIKRLVAEEVAPFMKKHGFRSKGLTFYRAVGDNFAILQLQKSQSSTAAVVKLTFNVSVFSGRLHRELGRLTWVRDISKVPTEPDCQLRERIGNLMPEARDVWWSLENGADPSALGAILRAALESCALPYLDARASDEGLRDHWLGLAARPDGREALSLAILLRDLGPGESLAPLLDWLRAECSPSAIGFNAAVERFVATVGPGSE